MIIVQILNQPGSDLILANSVRFWPNGFSPEASLCARIIGPASGQHFREPIKIGSDMVGDVCSVCFLICPLPTAERNTWVDLPPGSRTSITVPGLTLTPGLRYSFRVAAVNRAGGVATYDTDGVLVDPTAPDVSGLGLCAWAL